VETKWVAEIAENCPGVKLVLVALKCDLRRREDADDDENPQQPEKPMILYDEGLKVAERIRALRYLGKRCGLAGFLALFQNRPRSQRFAL
jgi:Rho family protein